MLNALRKISHSEKRIEDNTKNELKFYDPMTYKEKKAFVVQKGKDRYCGI